MRHRLLVAFVLLSLSGCDSFLNRYDFRVVVVNRTPHPQEVKIEGTSMGVIAGTSELAATIEIAAQSTGYRSNSGYHVGVIHVTAFNTVTKKLAVSNPITIQTSQTSYIVIEKGWDDGNSIRIAEHGAVELIE